MKSSPPQPASGDGIPLFLDHLVHQPIISQWLSGAARDQQIPLLKYIHGICLPFLLFILRDVIRRPMVIILQEQRLLPLLSEQLNLLLGDGLLSLSSTIFPSLTDTHQFNLFLSRPKCLLLVTERQFVSWSASKQSPNTASPSIHFRTDADPISIRNILDAWGYEQVHTVTTPGSFAVRGGILDVFHFSHELPLRIEFLGKHIDSVTTFDPITQRIRSPFPWKNSVLEAPATLRKRSDNQDILSHHLPRGASLLHIRQTDNRHLYNLTPWGRDSDTSGATFDLACLHKGPFNKNVRALRAELLYLNKKQDVAFYLFVDKRFGSLPSKENLLSSFSPVCFPAQGAFWSEPLKLFAVSLPSVLNLPKTISLPVRGNRAEEKDRLRHLESFRWGQHLVHEDLGIGLYRGLSTVDSPRGRDECVALEFAGGDVVHVPLERLHKVRPYVGSSNAAPPLTTLGSVRWEQLKHKTRRSAEKMVNRFIELYAERFRAKGYSFSADSELHAYLSFSFPYDETADQIRAYDAIRKDMESERPMDRLLCGDVGFGKTEIAVRAAFKAVYDHKQVIVLAPTTILANQHYLTFKSRLSPLGVNVAVLSRFTPQGRTADVLKGLPSGAIDVIVGTHRLLSGDVNVPRLGLVIIDEEHRFGARQKEILRALRSSVDVLTMSATPIPRTLQFSLLGIRDISMINTPPKARLPVTTSVSPFDEKLIKEAVLMEIERGGQVFFVHNRVKTIHVIAKKIQTLFPSLTVAVGHGQLPNNILEEVMINFLDRKTDILVCTTIIEAGIDLPNVNTIFINNAHQFGLAQLYQMRGRVGRSHRQAYCYLLTPATRKLTQDAHERLRTVQYYSSLGSGYSLALTDLQIRGPGNLFGLEQTGHIASIGYHLYCKIVEDVANRKLQKIPTEPPFFPVTVSINGDALLPPFYISDMSDRLYAYRRLSDCETVADLRELKAEIRERFGPFPEEVTNLFGVAQTRLSTQGSAVKKVVFSPQEVSVVLRKTIDRRSLFELAERLNQKLSDLGLSFRHAIPSEDEIQLSVKTSGLTAGFKTIEYLFESATTSANLPLRELEVDINP